VVQKRDKFGQSGGTYRIYHSSTDTGEGLAVSRSIGDMKAKKIGVISEPEIKHYNLGEDDQILILASDGIWQHMTIQNVAQIAQAHYEQG